MLSEIISSQSIFVAVYILLRLSVTANIVSEVLRFADKEFTGTSGIPELLESIRETQACLAS